MTAYIYVANEQLIVEYDVDKNIVVELPDEQDREIVTKLLGDVNLWAAFLNSLSSAITQHKER